MNKETPEQEAETLYPYDPQNDEMYTDSMVTNIQRSAHITAARQYMDTIEKLRAALEEIRELKSIDYSCYKKTQLIINEVLK